eukprot:scaffold74866_cov48-Phaeocystis_antarctica.AAC.3
MVGGRGGRARTPRSGGCQGWSRSALLGERCPPGSNQASKVGKEVRGERCPPRRACGRAPPRLSAAAGPRLTGAYTTNVHMRLTSTGHRR